MNITKAISDFFRFHTKGQYTDTKEAAGVHQILSSVEKFKNRTIYKVLTPGIIDTTPDEELVQTVFDSISIGLPHGEKEIYHALMALPEPRRVIYCIWLLDAEVNNGGFNQYYYNRGELYSGTLPQFFEVIGAHKTAMLVSKANEVYKANKDIITQYQDGTLEGFSKSYDDNPLQDLDNEFYDLADTEDLEALQIAYIREHKLDFCG